MTRVRVEFVTSFTLILASSEKKYLNIKIGRDKKNRDFNERRKKINGLKTRLQKLFFFNSFSFFLYFFLCLVFFFFFNHFFWYPEVNFTYILRSTFCQFSFHQKITNKNFKNRKVWKTLSYKKASHKVLVKLTPGPPSLFPKFLQPAVSV